MVEEFLCLTKSNNTSIKDIENIMGNIKRPAMIAAILFTTLQKKIGQLILSMI